MGLMILCGGLLGALALSGCDSRVSADPLSPASQAMPVAAVAPQNPGEPAPEAETEPVRRAPTDEELAARAAELRRHVPRGFHVVIERPFVVIGNQSRAVVERHAHGTIRSAVQRLKKDYFTQDPEEIIDVWLFGDGPSYRRYARELFGHTPDTPYGYYTEVYNALVMNVGTGAGTLIHEIVHPFMRANFEGVPPWFNEGLASLYECSTTRNGSIWGLTNWRLRGLRREIARGGLPSFETLMAKDEDAFYGDTAGDNYAESRYLLQYLQEKGLLKAYYHAFHAASEKDPTGYETLKAILGEKDMAGFQKRWDRWVMGLEFER